MPVAVGLTETLGEHLLVSGCSPLLPCLPRLLATLRQAWGKAALQKSFHQTCRGSPLLLPRFFTLGCGYGKGQARMGKDMDFRSALGLDHEPCCIPARW